MNYSWDWGVFFEPTGIGSDIYLYWFISGLGWTLSIALISWLGALLIGSCLGILRTLANPFPRVVAATYVEIFRNIPLLVQLFIWYFVVPDFLPEKAQEWFKQDLNPIVSAYVSVTVCLTLFTAARVCEQVRTGIQALPHGQEKAAKALGFGLWSTYRFILLPQSFRIIIPPLTTEFLAVFKNSSIASLVGLMELLAQAKQTAEFTSHLFEAFALATLIYFTLNMFLMFIMAKVEKRLALPGMSNSGRKAA